MSFTQLIIILIIALIVLGPEKLPQVARMLGKALAEFRRISGDFRSTIETEMREIERETALKELRQSFPPHIHYDLQETQETTTAASGAGAPQPEPVPADAALGTTETGAAVASGKPSNGEPTPA